MSCNKIVLTLNELKARLENAGVGVTAQRLAIAEYILNDGDHPTAREVFDAVQKKLPVVSQATIYNTLNKFVECALIREVKTAANGTVRYDGNMQPHHHLVNTTSGQIVDIAFDDVQIGNLEALKRKYNVDRITVTIEGKLR